MELRGFGPLGRNLDVTLRVAGQTLIDVRVRDGGPKGEDFILKASAQPTARSQRVTPHSGKPSPAYVQGLEQHILASIDETWG